MFFFFVFGFIAIATGLIFDPEHIGWNLNENPTAIDPLQYSGEWANHTFHPSPSNWRFPFYTLTIDRYVDGDPTNNEANGTMFEHDWQSNQLRFGGDAKGLMNHLDYIQGFGIKVCFRIFPVCISVESNPAVVGHLSIRKPFH
jgi:alpha-1,3-glucan synthase